ncbi:MAG: toxin-antitoxin system YwqK family antitoxin [Paludibacteraceae bacterium]|nr:toxin-antitoxin system YwqK family antitoxin [Paludibacteraceae bacterium]
MKRIILLLISALCIFCASASTPNETDKKGRKQGAWSKTYDNGQLMYEGTFKNDQPVGEFKRYFDSGKLKLVQNYTNGNRSTVKIYDADGKTISMEGAYIGKLKDGEWKFYNEGKLSLVEIYEKGKKEGMAKTYNKNGKLLSETPYENDKINGVKKDYLEDGKLFSEVTYKKGLREGVYKLYEGNEKPVVVGLYKNDKREGNWVVYNDKGEIDNTMIYENGSLKNAKEIKKKEAQTAEMNDEQKGKIQEPTELFPGSTVKEMK